MKILNKINKLYKKAEEFQTYNQFEEAAECFLKIAEYYFKKGIKLRAGSEYIGAADMFKKSGQIEKALNYYQHALDISKQLVKDYFCLRLQGAALIGIGNVLNTKGDLNKALNHYLNALEIFNQFAKLEVKLEEKFKFFNRSGNLEVKRKLLVNIGKIKQDLRDLDEAF